VTARALVPLALGAVVACGSRGAGPAARLSARIIRQSRDTLRFEVPAVASRCGRGVGNGLVLRGSEHGNGVLIYLRSSDSVARGEFGLMARADSTTPRGAIVTARFQTGEVAHGVVLDSGTVSVTRAGDVLTASAQGAGAEVAGTGRVTLAASVGSVRVGPDTVPCAARL
jgi:hypothetical protein